MNPETEKQITDAVLDNIELDTVFNKDDDSLPYGYFKARGKNFPSKDVGKLIWMCNYDTKDKITSVFLWTGDGKREKKVDYLSNIDEARLMRQQLIEDGWEKLKDPKISFSYENNGNKVEKTALNRREKRRLQKEIKKRDKRNPFKQL